MRFEGNLSWFTESTEWRQCNTVCIRSQNCKQDYSEWQHFHCWGRHLPLSLISLLSCSFLPVHQKSLMRTAPSGNQKERRQRDWRQTTLSALPTCNFPPFDLTGGRDSTPHVGALSLWRTRLHIVMEWCRFRLIVLEEWMAQNGPWQTCLAMMKMREGECGKMKFIPR